MRGIDLVKRLGSSSSTGSGGYGSITLNSVTISGETDALINIEGDGFVYEQDSPTPPAASYQWIHPITADPTNFEARATLLSGFSPGALNTWLGLGAGRSWGWLSQATPKNAVIRIDIRRFNGFAIYDSAIITLNVG